MGTAGQGSCPRHPAPALTAQGGRECGVTAGYLPPPAPALAVLGSALHTRTCTPGFGPPLPSSLISAGGSPVWTCLFVTDTCQAPEGLGTAWISWGPPLVLGTLLPGPSMFCCGHTITHQVAVCSVVHSSHLQAVRSLPPWGPVEADNGGYALSSAIPSVHLCPHPGLLSNFLKWEPRQDVPLDAHATPE